MASSTRTRIHYRVREPGSQLLLHEYVLALERCIVRIRVPSSSSLGCDQADIRWDDLFAHAVFPLHDLVVRRELDFKSPSHREMRPAPGSPDAGCFLSRRTVIQAYI